MSHEFKYNFSADDVESASGFVQEDDGWVVDEGASECDSLFLTRAKCGGAAVEKPAEVHALGEFSDAFVGDCGRESVARREVLEDFTRREPLVEPRAGGHESDVSFDLIGVFGDAKPQDFNIARGGSEQPEDHA